MKISISKRKLRDGRTSLYLDIHAGNARRRECLGIYLYQGSSVDVRQANRERLNAARKIMLEREMELINYRYDLESLPRLAPERPPFIFNKVLKTFRDYIKKYRQKDVRVVQSCYKQLDAYWKHRDRSFSALSRGDVSGFWNYLCANLNGSTPANYFGKFRGFILSLLYQDLIKEDPTNHIQVHYSTYRKKDALLPEEIQKLILTPCRNPELKRAFLFCCFCGLRWCDVCLLDYSQIDWDTRSMKVIQQKVKGHSQAAELHTYLNNMAMAQLVTGETEGQVFLLPSYNYSWKLLKEWAYLAGLRKNISFHCARHSFITNLMNSGVSLHLVAHLAGHSSIKHTERYVHTFEKEIQNAVKQMEEYFNRK